jgi:hypothetical protein
MNSNFLAGWDLARIEVSHQFLERSLTVNINDHARDTRNFHQCIKTEVLAGSEEEEPDEWVMCRSKNQN